MELRKSAIYRSGARGAEKVEEARPHIGMGSKRGSLGITGAMSVKGAQTFRIDIAKADFHRLLRVMVDLDEEYFLKAVEKAIALPDI